MGADWPLVQDAIVIAALALAAGGGATALFLKLRGKSASQTTAPAETDSKLDLEERVRVLERIATDQPRILAEEIEALRDKELETN